MTVQNPHDKFFRESFGRVHIARNYLEEYLPDPVLALLDLDTLTLQDGSFIDEEMRNTKPTCFIMCSCKEAVQPPSISSLNTRAFPMCW
jgi:predicted transposase YdaD